MVRHNLCLNPCLSNDVAGWGGGSTPTRVASPAGFDRPYAAEYTTNSYAFTAATANGAVVEGLTYTLSAYVRTSTFSVNSGTLYVEWLTESGTGFGYPSSGFTMPAQTITRVGMTATAPANAVAVRLIIDAINFPINPSVITKALTEQVGALDEYFDGDSVGGSWDGTPGNSSSTLADTAPAAAIPHVISQYSGYF
ncbi:hypothetical protein [Streptosporangium jomthongense]|uniref:Malectin domain-containing protein n=1 Tax=Streptosporangium jomthongense TaxID=1193683 RepID=A0ABV8FGT8_9ACTN